MQTAHSLSFRPPSLCAHSAVAVKSTQWVFVQCTLWSVCSCSVELAQSLFETLPGSQQTTVSALEIKLWCFCGSAKGTSEGGWVFIFSHTLAGSDLSQDSVFLDLQPHREKACNERRRVSPFTSTMRSVLLVFVHLCWTAFIEHVYQWWSVAFASVKVKIISTTIRCSTMLSMFSLDTVSHDCQWNFSPYPKKKHLLTFYTKLLCSPENVLL